MIFFIVASPCIFDINRSRARLLPGYCPRKTQVWGARAGSIFVRLRAPAAQRVEIVRGGVCEGCRQPARFADGKGHPFLEVHHVRHLAHRGSDRISNAVALCPNCHSRCHISDDKDGFAASLYERIERLIVEADDDGDEAFVELIDVPEHEREG
jgi:hypothetical protein